MAEQTAAGAAADDASDASDASAKPGKAATAAKAGKTPKSRRALGMATVVKPCLIGAALLTVVHAATGK